MVFFTFIGLTLIGFAGFLHSGDVLGSLEPLHWVEGTLAAIALALLVGRLESGLLKSNPFLIAALYGYHRFN